MKNKALIPAILCMVFLILGSVSAADINVNNSDDSNLIQEDNNLSLKSLDVSSNYSVSDINSHDDNLNNYPSGDDSNYIDESNYEDNGNLQQTSSIEDDYSTVNKVDNPSSVLTTNDTELYYGGKLNSSLVDDNNVPISNTNITFTINSESYNVPTNEKGIASLDITLAPGSYDVVTSALGNTVQSNLTVLSTIDASDVVKYYKNGTQYYATFFDSNGNKLANTEVIISIIGKNYTVTTDKDGVGILDINLIPGNYTITAINTITNQTRVNTVTVLSTIAGNNIVKYYRNGTQYYATFVDADGTPLANKKVTFSIIGKSYAITTDSNGTAKLDINLNPGEYIITAINPINGQMYSNNITVLWTIVNNENLVKYYRNGSQYYATFLNPDGTPLVNSEVSFNIIGKFYTAITDENGTAELAINLNPGTYIITGINKDGLQKSNNITVLNTINGSDIEKEYKNGTQYQATFLNPDGTPLVNKEVNFNIGGMIYTVITNENGTAILNIDLVPGNYIVTDINPVTGQLYSNNIKVVPANTVISGKDVQVLYGSTVNYETLLTYQNGQPISNVTVTFNVNKKSYTAKTNDEGIATVSLTNLPYGENLITYGITGQTGYNNAKGSSTINVINSTSLISGENVNVTWGGDNSFNVLLTNLTHDALANKTITFTINGVSYNRTTNEEGIASLDIKNLTPGTYTIEYSYSTPSSMDYVTGSSSINVNKQTVDITGSDLTFNYGEDGRFEVKVTLSNGTILTNATVIFSIIGKEYEEDINEEGIASLPIRLKVGYYDISYTLGSNDLYQSKTYNNTVLVDGFIITGDSVYVSVGTSCNFEVLLTNAKGEPVADAPIVFKTSKGETYEAITNKEGVASIALSNLTVGEYNIGYYYSSSIMNVSGTNTIYVKNAISIADLIKAATTVKNYIENNYALPSSVTIGDSVYSMPQFLYLISAAIVNLNKGITEDIAVVDVLNPENPVNTTTTLGNLYTYADVAQDIVNYINTNGVAPNSMSSDVGTIGYDGLIYALTRVVAWYGANDNTLPRYTAVKPVSVPITVGPLDNINTFSKSELAVYLEPSANCQVNNAKIQALAASLTEGLTSDLAKATAIYNYVRDKISYSSYYNTRYGAVGTLERGYGNCCDQTQLLVALCRAAGLYARFVHSSYCVFNSGTYGHVYAQILIGDVWVVADTTSSRNSFGVVNNWNNYNHGTLKYYASLPF